ncbi:MAG: hypothetical protein ACPG05_03895, partial [Bdellovibrionales bacterium]
MKYYLSLFVACLFLSACQTTFEDIQSDIRSWWGDHGRFEAVERVSHDFKFRTVSLGSPVFI